MKTCGRPINCFFCLRISRVCAGKGLHKDKPSEGIPTASGRCVYLRWAAPFFYQLNASCTCGSLSSRQTNYKLHGSIRTFWLSDRSYVRVCMRNPFPVPCTFENMYWPVCSYGRVDWHFSSFLFVFGVGRWNLLLFFVALMEYKNNSAALYALFDSTSYFKHLLFQWTIRRITQVINITHTLPRRLEYDTLDRGEEYKLGEMRLS